MQHQALLENYLRELRLPTFAQLCRHFARRQTLSLSSMKPGKTRIGMAALSEALSKGLPIAS
jgi:hypothetical protein